MLLYNVACVFSLLGRVEPAIACLEKASRNGLTNEGWYEHDSNLDPVRKHLAIRSQARNVHSAARAGSRRGRA